VIAITLDVIFLLMSIDGTTLRGREKALPSKRSRQIIWGG